LCALTSLIIYIKAALSSKLYDPTNKIPNQKIVKEILTNFFKPSFLQALSPFLMQEA
jgi:hypothetical protein